jgi:hypothetical protein
MYGELVAPSVVVGFLDRDYRYKSVATQIPHDTWLIPIPYTGQKLIPHRGIEPCVLYDRREASRARRLGNTKNLQENSMHYLQQIKLEDTNTNINNKYLFIFALSLFTKHCNPLVNTFIY